MHLVALANLVNVLLFLDPWMVDYRYVTRQYCGLFSVTRDNLQLSQAATQYDLAIAYMCFFFMVVENNMANKKSF